MSTTAVGPCKHVIHPNKPELYSEGWDHCPFCELEAEDPELARLNQTVAPGLKALEVLHKVASKDEMKIPKDKVQKEASNSSERHRTVTTVKKSRWNQNLKTNRFPSSS